MQYIFDAWPAVEARLAPRPGGLSMPGTILVLSDFDGTLAPIVPVPDDACLPPFTRTLLEQLAAIDRYLLGIVSGRALADLKGRVSIPGIIYAGNYGLEMESPWASVVHPRAEGLRRTIDGLYHHLQGALTGIEGVLVEYKTLSLSVHYRLASSEDHGRIKKAVDQALMASQVGQAIDISAGKKVWELTPSIDWDKGNVVDYLLDGNPRLCRPVLPLFLGDDRCDEPGFAAVDRYDGISIFVGDGPETWSRARYFLRCTDDVAEFLRRLLALA